MNMTAVLTQRCNIRCRHCYLPSIDYNKGMKDDLPLDVFIQAVKKLSASFSDNIKEIYLTGGEFLLLSYGSDVVNIMRQYFPKSKIFAYTNGILLFENEELFNKVKPDYFHLGIDFWHNNVRKDGSCEILELFIKKYFENKDFKIIVHWTESEDENDYDNYKVFYERYNINNPDVYFEYRPLNTDIGRSGELQRPEYKKANSWRSCTFGHHIMYTFRNECFACHWGIKQASLGNPLKTDIKQQLEIYDKMASNNHMHDEISNTFFDYIIKKYNIESSINRCSICENLNKKGIDLFEEADCFYRGGMQNE